MFKKIEAELKSVKGEDEGYNPGHLWKLKKGALNNTKRSPRAMKDKDGNLLTSDKEIRNEALKHYDNVFEEKPIDIELK